MKGWDYHQQNEIDKSIDRKSLKRKSEIRKKKYRAEYGWDENWDAQNFGTRLSDKDGSETKSEIVWWKRIKIYKRKFWKKYMKI